MERTDLNSTSVLLFLSHPTSALYFLPRSKMLFSVWTRCLELDCWDGENGEPVITHGRTLCTRIPFVKVLEAIADTAFINSPYPVILSFENHCSKEQMKRMSDHCRCILGQYLLDRFLPGDGPDFSKPGQQGSLPSPEALKYKIVIKNRKASSLNDSEDAGELMVNGHVIPEAEDDKRARKERAVVQNHIAQELSDLVNYCTPYSFKVGLILPSRRQNGQCKQADERQGVKLLDHFEHS